MDPEEEMLLALIRACPDEQSQPWVPDPEDDLLLDRLASGGAEPASGPGSDREIVEGYLHQSGIAPGRTSSVETVTLYRHYVEWHRAELPGAPLVTPSLFSRSLGALGFRKRLAHQSYRFSLVTSDAAAALKRWDRFHPVPLGYRQWFRAMCLSSGRLPPPDEP